MKTKLFLYLTLILVLLGCSFFSNSNSCTFNDSAC